MAHGDRCESRLTTTSLDFTGPMTFQCSQYEGHYPETPHKWALEWTDLGSDQFRDEVAEEMAKPVEVITEGRLHSVSIDYDGLFKEPGTLTASGGYSVRDTPPVPEGIEYQSPEYWAWLQDNAGKDRP